MWMVLLPQGIQERDPPLILRKAPILVSERTARVEDRINFIGTIDDFRLYSKELNATAVSALYASGAGEGYYTSTIPTLTVDEYANSSPVPVSVTFKRGGSNLPVAGFASSDISVSGWYRQ